LSTEKKESSAPVVAGINTIKAVDVEIVRQAGEVLKELYRASKSNPLMGIVAYAVTVDLYQKLGILWPNSAQSLREALFTAIGLSFDFSKLQNLKLWEQDIPIIGFLFTSTNVQYESILKTSMTVDATGGESIVEKAVGDIGEALGGGGEPTTKQDIESVRRLKTLQTLLSSIPEAAAGG
jgi:hypothetical protein